MTRELSDEELKKAEEYSEENPYLKKALILCWKNGIRTHACCGGHKSKDSYPYLSIIINEEGMDGIKKIIGNLQDMKDMSIELTVRGKSTDINDIYPNSECRALSIRCYNHNRCELFFRVAEALEKKEEIELNTRGRDFFTKVQEFNNMSYDEIIECVKSEVYFLGSMRNISGDYIRYQEYKLKGGLLTKLKRLPIIRKLFEVFSKKLRKENRDYDKLKKVYKIFQESYTPNEEDIRTRIHSNVPTGVSPSMHTPKKGILKKKDKDLR